MRSSPRSKTACGWCTTPASAAVSFFAMDYLHQQAASPHRYVACSSTHLPRRRPPHQVLVLPLRWLNPWVSSGVASCMCANVHRRTLPALSVRQYRRKILPLFQSRRGRPTRPRHSPTTPVHGHSTPPQHSYSTPHNRTPHPPSSYVRVRSQACSSSIAIDCKLLPAAATAVIFSVYRCMHIWCVDINGTHR